LGGVADDVHGALSRSNEWQRKYDDPLNQTSDKADGAPSPRTLAMSDFVPDSKLQWRGADRRDGVLLDGE
jgi:hypothetical protein